MHVLGIYHKDCIDGTAAAAALLKAYPDAELHPLPHAHKPEAFASIAERVTPETKFYALDCTFGAREFLVVGATVVVIDHHADKKAELDALASEYPSCTIVFDESKSGAMLAWHHLTGGASRIIELVEDVDLWKWKFGDDSKHATCYLWMFVNDPASMLATIEGDTTAIIEKGKLLSTHADMEIARLCATEPVPLRIGGHAVLAFNVGTHKSAVGNILSEREQAAVGIFTIQGERVKISFRSKDGQSPNAHALAASLGGGGHPHAASATVPLTDFIRMLG